MQPSLASKTAARVTGLSSRPAPFPSRIPCGQFVVRGAASEAPPSASEAGISHFSARHGSAVVALTSLASVLAQQPQTASAEPRGAIQRRRKPVPGPPGRPHSINRATTIRRSTRELSAGFVGAVVAVSATAAAPAAADSPQAELIPTSWNAFQKANKGKGYSPTTMGQLWRQHKVTYLSGPSSATINNSAASGSSNTRSSSSSSSSSMDLLAAAGSGSSARAVIAVGSAAAHADIPASWNAFQKANKGKGYSPSTMGQLWQEHKATYLSGPGSSSSNMRDVAAGAGLVSTQVVIAISATAAATAATADSPELLPTTWNAFQKANKGKGYSGATMGQQWREHKRVYRL